MTGWLGREAPALAAAVAIMTRIPMPPAAHEAKAARNAPRYFAVAGLAVGSVGAGVFLLADHVFPQIVTALLSTAATLLLTGALHEDGFADCCDGVGGGRTRERALEIMKDSRLGAYGAIGLFLALALKVTALSILPLATAASALACGHPLSRASIVLAMASNRYVRDADTPTPQAAQVGLFSVLFSLVVGVALLPVLMPVVALGGAFGAVLGHIGMRVLYERKLGGFTGDCLGAVQQVTELGFLLGTLAVAAN
jgi:adenosylcobinamide-GDP ribazoletransferase